MPRYTKASLDALRQKIDLVEVLGSHVQLKKAGGSYKALCPFHDEKSPSFVVQRGDTHYHCFGCGAHGDAIQFLMQHVRMTFSDAVAHLAERFSVHLEEESGTETSTGPSKTRLKELLAAAQRFFQYYLLHAEDAAPFMRYLNQRGITLPFIHAFDIGLAPRQEGLLRSFLHKMHFSDEEMIESGLLVLRGGKARDFFQERIMFAIHDQVGSCIGFSARKIRDEVYGGKYINTPETSLFKKSRVLFGLNYSRKRIAKERQAIIVEGQLDALRLIFHGFDYTVAALGTAFGEAHVRELERLGVTKVFLLFDGDPAGRSAALKVGHLFQKIGIEVMVATLAAGSDPDLLLVRQGPIAVTRELISSKEYIPFLIDELSKSYNVHSPADKQKIVDEVKKRLAEWMNSVMVHESLKKAARILNLPEDLIAMDLPAKGAVSKPAAPPVKSVDPSMILEADLLRWLILCAPTIPELLAISAANLTEADFRDPMTKNLFAQYLTAAKENRSFDLIECAAASDDARFQDFVSLILHKKINREKAKELFVSTVQKLKERNWLFEREEIKVKIHSGMAAENEVLELVRKFDTLKKNPPKVIV